MESALAPTTNATITTTAAATTTAPTMTATTSTTQPRLIEYPSDLSGCTSMTHEGRNLLFICSHETESSTFVVVLGYFSGQKEDVVTKDLIEPISESSRRSVGEAVLRQVSQEFSGAHIFFL
jgi:hypothetical protein